MAWSGVVGAVEVPGPVKGATRRPSGKETRRRQGVELDASIVHADRHASMRRDNAILSK
jgi:hypothetical protein